MSLASLTTHFGARHEHDGKVRNFHDGARKRIVKARPPRSGVVLGRRIEQRRPATSAHEGPRSLFLVQLAGERTLCRLLSEHLVRERLQLCLPLILRERDIPSSFEDSHGGIARELARIGVRAPARARQRGAGERQGDERTTTDDVSLGHGGSFIVRRARGRVTAGATHGRATSLDGNETALGHLQGNRGHAELCGVVHDDVVLLLSSSTRCLALLLNYFLSVDGDFRVHFERKGTQKITTTRSPAKRRKWSRLRRRIARIRCDGWRR